VSLRRTITTALLAAGLVTVGATGPAQAGPPEKTIETQDFVREAHPLFSEACGFPVDVHVWGEFLVRTWTDDEGNPQREFRQFKFRSETYANGKSVSGLTMGPETAVFNADGSTTVHIRGIVNRTVPGAGTVKLAWGSGITIWPADGGEDIIVEPTGGPESLQPLCDYLAP
jgi:hypothetical protein